MKNLFPMLICDDVRESIRFYTEVLGFRVTDRMDNIGRSGWASLDNGQARIMLASPHGGLEAVKVNGRHPQTLYYFYPDPLCAEPGQRSG